MRFAINLKKLLKEKKNIKSITINDIYTCIDYMKQNWNVKLHCKFQTVKIVIK